MAWRSSLIAQLLGDLGVGVLGVFPKDQAVHALVMSRGQIEEAKQVI
jgi:hypothetical protein